MAKDFRTNEDVADLESEQQADLCYPQITSVCKQIANDSKYQDRKKAEIHQVLISRHCNRYLISCRIIADNNIEISLAFQWLGRFWFLLWSTSLSP